MMKIENLKLTQEWDKTFPKSEKVDHCKVSFVNRYGTANTSITRNFLSFLALPIQICMMVAAKERFPLTNSRASLRNT